MPDNVGRGMHPNNLQKFEPSRLSAGANLVIGMDSISRERLIDGNEAANPAGTDKPFPIKSVIQRFVERADNFPRLPRPEGAGLIDEI